MNTGLLWTGGLAAGVVVLGAVAALAHAVARPVREIERYARDTAVSATVLRGHLEVAEALGRVGAGSEAVRRRLAPVPAAGPPPGSQGQVPAESAPATPPSGAGR